MSDDYDTTLLNTASRLPVGPNLVLGLLHCGREYRLRPGDLPFAIGRDGASCQLCVPYEYSSRQHCTIAFRENKFVLRDDSTNGTYLQLGRAGNLRVHRETVPLIGHGCFKLGQDFRADDPDLIHFVIREMPG